MMNDKDLAREMEEKIANIFMDLLKTGELDGKLDELTKSLEETKEIFKKYPLGKVSDFEKHRVKKAFMRIGNNASVAGILGFALLKNGEGIFTFNFDEGFKVDLGSALSMILNIGYESMCDDVDDDDEFEDFLCGIIEDVRMIRKVQRGLKK